jgi:hypothetical protein
MSDQSRRARADWTAFDATGGDLETRADALGLEREDLAAQAEPLELAVEGGILEYKRTLLNDAFRAIEQARYRSLTGAQILGIAKQFGVYAYVATVQRFMADGTMPLREHRPKAEEPEPSEADEAEADVKQIIAEIQERVKKEPELRTRQPVKNILMQLSRYSRELEQFKDVTARTPPDKRGNIAKNFRMTTEEIFASIRRNYQQLEREEREAMPTQPQNILLRIPVDKLSGLFLKQSRAAVEVRSGLLFAHEEQYQTRELLLSLADYHERMLAMVDEEETSYRELTGTDRLAILASRTFAGEVKKRIERETEVY